MLEHRNILIITWSIVLLSALGMNCFTIDNDRILLGFTEDSGSLEKLVDKASGYDSVGVDTSSFPLWEITFVDDSGDLSIDNVGRKVQGTVEPALSGNNKISSEVLTLTWKDILVSRNKGRDKYDFMPTTSFVDVSLTIELPKESILSLWRISVDVREGRALGVWEAKLSVPLTIGASSDGVLFFPSGFGTEYDDPIKSAGGGVSSLYPGSGATMQFMALSTTHTAAGLESSSPPPSSSHSSATNTAAATAAYVAAYDPAANPKRLEYTTSMALNPELSTEKVPHDPWNPSRDPHLRESTASASAEGLQVKAGSIKPSAGVPTRAGPSAGSTVQSFRMLEQSISAHVASGGQILHFLSVTIYPADAGTAIQRGGRWTQEYDVAVGVVPGGVDAQQGRPLYHEAGMLYRDWALREAEWAQAGPLRAAAAVRSKDLHIQGLSDTPSAKLASSASFREEDRGLLDAAGAKVEGGAGKLLTAKGGSGGSNSSSSSSSSTANDKSKSHGTHHHSEPARVSQSTSATATTTAAITAAITASSSTISTANTVKISGERDPVKTFGERVRDTAHRKRAPLPDWYRSNSIWLNTHWQCHDIFNETGGDPAYVASYTKRVAALLDQPSVALHWYEWQQGPDPSPDARYKFDTHYPDYFPPREGPTLNFKQAVQQLRDESGVYTVPYINGRIFDIASDSYLQVNGDQYCAKEAPTRIIYPPEEQDKSGVRGLVSYRESYGSNATFCVANPSTQYWQDKVADTVGQLVNDWGVHGVYIDQIGSAGPKLCWDSTHGHTLGGGPWWRQGYAGMLDAIDAQLSSSSPSSPSSPSSFSSSSTAAAPAPIVTEDNAEPYMDMLQGYLTLVAFKCSPALTTASHSSSTTSSTSSTTSSFSSNYKRLAPAFPAVYGGYYIGFGAQWYQLDFADHDWWRGKLAATFITGTQMGWFSLTGVEDDPQDSCGNMGVGEMLLNTEENGDLVEYLKLLAHARSLPVVVDYMVDGHLARPLVMHPPPAVRTQTVPSGDYPPFDYDSVAVASWKLDDRGSVLTVFASTTAGVGTFETEIVVDFENWEIAGQKVLEQQQKEKEEEELLLPLKQEEVPKSKPKPEKASSDEAKSSIPLLLQVFEISPQSGERTQISLLHGPQATMSVAVPETSLLLLEFVPVRVA